MKRIVQCPKCEAKLSVFDSGKPISQKCPKCANTFEVTPEGAVEPPAPEAPAEKPPAEKEETVSAPKAQKPVAPAASAMQPEPVIVESGISFLHVLAIFAVLFVIIAVQVWTFKMMQSRFNRLEEQVHALATQVQKLKAAQ